MMNALENTQAYKNKANEHLEFKRSIILLDYQSYGERIARMDDTLMKFRQWEVTLLVSATVIVARIDEVGMSLLIPIGMLIFLFWLAEARVSASRQKIQETAEHVEKLLSENNFEELERNLSHWTFHHTLKRKVMDKSVYTLTIKQFFGIGKFIFHGGLMVIVTILFALLTQDEVVSLQQIVDIVKGIQ